MNDDARLIELGQEVDRALDVIASDRPKLTPSERVRLLDTRARTQAARRVTRALSSVALAAVLVFVAAWLFRDRSLTFQVAEQAGRAGQWTLAERRQTLSFSDGSTLVLEPGSRLRVDQLDARGARVTLEGGQLRADIRHREETSWQVFAGPHEIHVRGTRFSVDWRSETGAFRLELHEGSVVVETPGRRERHLVNAPQVLEMSLQERRTSLSVAPGQDAASASPAEPALAQSAPPQASALPAPAPAVAPAVRGPRGDRVERSNAGGVPVVEPSWRELAAQARHRDALIAAEHEGFPALCERLSARELLNLADSARLAGNPARASEALRRLRERFPGSAEAAFAAYSLGTVSYRSPERAAHWFSTYLSEAPSGPLAREALGRLMEAELQRGNRGQAVELSRRYLARYPGGPHADVARRIQRP